MSALRMHVARSITFSLLLLIAGFEATISQSLPTDSLLAIIKAQPDNEEKIINLNKLSSMYRRSGDSAGVAYAVQSLQLAHKLSSNEYVGDALNQMAMYARQFHRDSVALIYFDSALYYYKKDHYPQKRADVFNKKGIMAMQQRSFDEAMIYYDSAYQLYEEINDSSYMVNVLYNIGITYEQHGIYVTALEYFFKCLALDELMDNKEGIASDYTSIAVAFKKQGDYENSIDYYLRSLNISESANDEMGIASALTNLGVVYKDLGEYDKSVEMQNRALGIFKGMGHLRGEVIALHNLAVVSFKSGNLKQSEQYLQSSSEINNQFEDKMVNLSNGILRARIYLRQNALQNALESAQNSRELAKKHGLPEEQHEATVLISDIYENMGQYALALEANRQGMQLKDSIYNLGKSRQIHELQTRYETSRKEARIELLNKEKALSDSELKRKSLQQKMTFGGITLILLIGFSGFRSYRLRQKQQRTILDQQLLNEKLEAERLHELDEAKSRFFANIAHEFRTPLTLILGPSEQILEESAEQRSIDNAHLIRRNADKLLSLTNQLLDLSKLESGMIKLLPLKRDFIAFAKGCIHAFESLALERDIKVMFHSTIEKFEMDFDPEKTSAILSNIISNALKFTEPFGSVTATVKRHTTRTDIIQLEVADTGIGIPEKQLSHIFDRFYQVDDTTTRRTQGTGIGLALAKELTELHGGSIAVESIVGKGTTFLLELPVWQSNTGEAESQAVKSSTEKAVWASNANDKKALSESFLMKEIDRNTEQTVLVVEDNLDVRRFIVEILSSFYTVIEAKNGKSGLEMAITRVPDLVISDVMMPEMDGFELSRLIKADERTSHIPLVLLTSKAGIDNKLEGLETGADDYLGKPFNARELLTRIKNLIATRHKLQQKYQQTGDDSLFAGKENAFITKLKTVIEENIDKEEFSMDELGKALAMSRTQVHRKLKALTSLSTSQFIRQYKLEKALKLLKTREYNVSEVAYMLGFNTPNYFSSCFTEQFGFRPSEVGK